MRSGLKGEVFNKDEANVRTVGDAECSVVTV